MFTVRLRLRTVADERREFIERIERLRACAEFDFVYECDESRGDWGCNAGRAPKFNDNAELRIDFGGAFANREVTPDAAVCLGRSAIVGNEMIERLCGGADGCRGEVR